MSGTSLDGIDAALVRIVPKAAGYDVALERFVTLPFEEGLRARLQAALPPNKGSAEDVARLNAELGAAFANAARAASSGERVDFAASHGLTLFHDGSNATTLQIGRPYDVRDALQATVVWDFRSADCAVGGEGAPLVPYVDALLLGSVEEDRVAVNIGGICNLTVLPRGSAPERAFGFDCGPGVMLLDAFVCERTGEPFDRDGMHAAAGNADETVLAHLLSDPYFARTPPKSTGRERFGHAFLALHAEALRPLSLEDGCATLAELSIRPLAAAIARYAPDARSIIVGGGGSRNRTLVAMLQRALPQHARVVSSDAMGIDADAKEAIVFAVLGYETLRGRAANAPLTTGARTRAVLGSIAPFDLPSLLMAIGKEILAARS